MPAGAASTVEGIRLWSENGRTRVVLDLSQPSEHSIFTLRGPDRLVVDLKDSKLGDALDNLPSGGAIRSIMLGIPGASTAASGPAPSSHCGRLRRNSRWHCLGGSR